MRSNHRSGRDNSRDILCDRVSIRRFFIVVAIITVILIVVGYHIEAEKIAEWEATGVWQW